MNTHVVAAGLILLIGFRAEAQPVSSTATDPALNPGAADVALPLRIHSDPIHLIAGFSGVDGSFAALTWKTRDLFHFSEVTDLTVEVGVRTRRIQWGLSRPAAFGTRWNLGVTASVRRFHFNQEKDSSLTAFDRDILLYVELGRDKIDYTSNGYGFTAFAQRPFHNGLSHFDLVYSYDVASLKPITTGTMDYFGEFAYLGSPVSNRLSGIRTSQIEPSYTWNTVDNPFNPSRGTYFTGGVRMAGPGGDVNLIEPSLEAKHYRRGIRRRDVIAFRVRGRVIRGFRGKSAPPFDRYFMGGEDDIRGLSDWSASPITFMPDRVTVPVLNSDGSQRIQNVVIDNMIVAVPVTMQIPIFRPVALGGDMNAVANAEYRVPLKGPFTLVFFADLGLNKIVFADQLRLDPEFLNGLNNEFQEAGFSNSFSIAPHTQDFRMSTGAELRARIPKVGVPVRFYWAWDPRIDDRYIQPPIVADRSMFPNQTTFESAINTYAPAYLDQQSRNAFRFSIGRTF